MLQKLKFKLNENVLYLVFQIMENRIWINFDLLSYKVVFEVKIEGNF